MKLPLAVLALALLLGTVCAPASALGFAIITFNQTDVCVWVTVDFTVHAQPPYGWYNKFYGFVKRGESIRFDEPAIDPRFQSNRPVYFKLRAQPRRTVACDGPELADIQETGWMPRDGIGTIHPLIQGPPFKIRPEK